MTTVLYFIVKDAEGNTLQDSNGDILCYNKLRDAEAYCDLCSAKGPLTPELVNIVEEEYYA